jgi:transglutaminase-like putative cysteine protease
MTIVCIRHVTLYCYRSPVRLGEHRMTFRPQDSYDQRLIHSILTIEPYPADIHWLHDAFGNSVAVARFEGLTRDLRFESRVMLDHAPSNAPEVRIEDRAKTYPFSYTPEELPDLAPCIARNYPDPGRKVERWVRQFLRRSGATPTGELLKTITYAIKDGFAYTRRLEPGTWPPAETLAQGRGSCRDLALFMIEAVRALGLAARFVSGYIYVPERDDDGSRLGGGSTHAWCQVYLPGAGWVEFDPTNGIVGNADLIRVAVARDPSQAIPLSGTWYGEPDVFESMRVDVEVTKPAPGSGAADAA